MHGTSPVLRLSILHLPFSIHTPRKSQSLCFDLLSSRNPDTLRMTFVFCVLCTQYSIYPYAVQRVTAVVRTAVLRDSYDLYFKNMCCENKTKK